jgi:hypothetical protein
MILNGLRTEIMRDTWKSNVSNQREQSKVVKELFVDGQNY